MTVLSDRVSFLLAFATEEKDGAQKCKIPFLANSAANGITQGQQLSEIRWAEMRNTKIFRSTTAADRQRHTSGPTFR
jgi:hypothetical protein